MRTLNQKQSLFTILFLGIYFFSNAQNIGINTTNAQSTLSVKGGLGIGTNYSANSASPTDGAIIEGKVGIGTDAPTHKLHVIGDAKIVGRTSIEDSLSVNGFSKFNSGIESQGDAIINAGRIRFISTGNSIFIGEEAGINDNGNDRINTFIGNGAGKSNVSGFANVYIGSNAGNENVEGESNIAIGEAALATNTKSFNTAIGKFALQNNNEGEGNTAIGNYAGFGSAGSQNFFIGTAAGESATGSGNVFIGNEVGSYSNVSNRLWIHNSNSNQPLIEGHFQDRKLKINGKLYTSERVGIKTDSPTSDLEVNGTMALKVKANLESGSTDPDESGGIWIYTSDGGTIDLPAPASCPNRTYSIVNKTASSLSIDDYKDMTNSIKNIIHSASSILIVSDGTNWQQIK